MKKIETISKLPEIIESKYFVSKFFTKYKIVISPISIPKYPAGVCFEKKPKNNKMGIKNQ